jgi:hypothetical protein
MIFQKLLYLSNSLYLEGCLRIVRFSEKSVDSGVAQVTLLIFQKNIFIENQ